MSGDFPTFLTAAQLADLFGPRVTESYIKGKVYRREWPHVIVSREPHFTAENVREIAAIEEVPAKTDAPVQAANSHGQRTRGSRAS